jgi:hypothetical protein
VPPEVQALIDALRRLRLTLEPLDRSAPVGWRWLELRAEAPPAQRWCLAVDDEYGDVDAGGAPLRLHLVLCALEDYEDAEDFLVWAREQGLSSSDPGPREIWLALREVQASLRARLAGLEPISRFDWQLGAGASDALRAARL